jgi:hypothetical protein
MSGPKIINLTKMELEKQVISLDLAKRLHELLAHIPPTLFWWCEHGNEVKLEYGGDCPQLTAYPAFTVAELGEMLPLYTRTWYCLSSSTNDCWIGKVGQLPEHNYKIFPFKGRVVEVGKDLDYFWANSEADARAKMVIYLLENKLI